MTTTDPTLTPESAAETVDRAYRSLAPLLRDVSERKFGIPPADAEAVVNTVFETFLRRRATVRDLERYLIASVCNASRDYWRARKNTQPMPDDADRYVAAATIDAEERLVRSLTIAVRLTQLGNQCCEALYLFHLGGYSASEIAERLGTTQKNMWKVLSKCRRRAQELLADMIGRES